MDWNVVTIAGGFIAGVIVGGVAVLRVTRHVMGWLRGTPPHGTDTP